MTREDVKAILKNCLDKAEYKHGAYGIALDMAIKALEQEPCDEYGNYKYPGDIELTEPNTATSMPCGDVISRQAVNALVDELARAISDERCFISRGRSTATIMQDILDLPPVNPQENERNCVTCERSKDGHSAGTEECHLCMWESQYKPKTGHWIPVNERLPEINDDVLISLEWGIDIGRYSGGEWCSEWINNYDDGNVLAWMPLPEPYEPQEI